MSGDWADEAAEAALDGAVPVGAYVQQKCRDQPIGKPISEMQVQAWWAEGERVSRISAIAAALRAERERCAGIAEDVMSMHERHDRLDHAYTSMTIRDRIRAGDQP